MVSIWLWAPLEARNIPREVLPFKDPTHYNQLAARNTYLIALLSFYNIGLVLLCLFGVILVYLLLSTISGYIATVYVFLEVLRLLV